MSTARRSSKPATAAVNAEPTMTELMAIIAGLAKQVEQLSNVATVAKPAKPAKAPRQVDPGIAKPTFTVTAGTRPGFVQLAFDAKPDDVARAKLTANGFRWNRATRVWWGPETAAHNFTKAGQVHVGRSYQFQP